MVNSNRPSGSVIRGAAPAAAAAAAIGWTTGVRALKVYSALPAPYCCHTALSPDNINAHV